MSSNLKHLTLGRRPEDGQARSAMLSRLGIAEEKPADIYREPEPEPAPQVEALAAAPQVEPLAAAPSAPPLRTTPWVSPANDEQPESAAEKPAFAIPAPPAQAAVAEEEEDPFEAIRRQYRNPPKATLPLSLPTNIALPEIPASPFKMVPVGERRRKAGELSTSRKVIWGLSWAAAALIGWSLLTGDENNMIVQVFGLLLP